MSDIDPIGWDWFFSQLQAASMGEGEITDVRQRLERARSVMHVRFADPLDLEAVAREAYLSRFHFAREFRRLFGVTPHQYLTQRRVEQAKRLLLETDKSVTEVCMSVGFSSLGSFSTMFQRRVGHSPNNYRRAIVQSLGIPAKLPPIPTCFLAHFATARSVAC